MSIAIASFPKSWQRKRPALLSNRKALLSRLIFRLPLIVYRLGPGGLLGVTPVAFARRCSKCCIVASASGRQSNRYRNIQSRAAVAVQIASDSYVPEQRTVSGDEAHAVFNDWVRRQRWFARLMLGQIGQRIDVPEPELRALVESFPFVAFRPTAGGSKCDSARWIFK